MADVTVTIDANGNANDPGVKVGQTIQWTLGSGVTGPFALTLPANMFHNNDNPGCTTLNSTTTSSSTYTVKQSATVGNHYYSIAAGNCGGADRGTATGAQTITVDTGTGGPADSEKHHEKHHKQHSGH